jgi:DNA-binding NarL/FixJ family response regulator
LIRLLIIAEVRLYRDGLAQVLEHYPELEVVGVAAGGKAAVDLAVATAPDLVLLDVGIAGVETVARSLLQLTPGVSIVGIGVAECERNVLACVEAGISGYVPREASIQHLVAVIKSVLQGRMLCPSDIAGALARRLMALSAAKREPELTTLTIREREIAKELERGLSNKQIAVRLHIEVATVKNHIHSILQKLGAQSRGEAVARFRCSTEPLSARLEEARSARRPGRPDSSFDSDLR